MTRRELGTSATPLDRDLSPLSPLKALISRMPSYLTLPSLGYLTRRIELSQMCESRLEIEFLQSSCDLQWNTNHRFSS